MALPLAIDLVDTTPPVIECKRRGAAHLIVAPDAPTALLAAASDQKLACGSDRLVYESSTADALAPDEIAAGDVFCIPRPGFHFRFEVVEATKTAVRVVRSRCTPRGILMHERSAGDGGSRRYATRRYSRRAFYAMLAEFKLPVTERPWEPSMEPFDLTTEKPVPPVSPALAYWWANGAPPPRGKAT